MMAMSPDGVFLRRVHVMTKATGRLILLVALVFKRLIVALIDASSVVYFVRFSGADRPA